MVKEPSLTVELTVDNKNVEMNEFVQKITGNLLWAILKSLRLDKEPASAAFKIEIRQ
jgi:hypothetical protein